MPDLEKTILKELLLNEFKGIKTRVEWRELKTSWACIPPSRDVIYLDMRYQGEFRDAPGLLREVLRHELLHLEMDKGERSKKFQRECKKRKIYINAEDMLGLADVRYEFGGDNTAHTSTSFSMVFNPFTDS